MTSGQTTESAEIQKYRNRYWSLWERIVKMRNRWQNDLSELIEPGSYDAALSDCLQDLKRVLKEAK